MVYATHHRCSLHHMCCVVQDFEHKTWFNPVVVIAVVLSASLSRAEGSRTKAQSRIAWNKQKQSHSQHSEHPRAYSLSRPHLLGPESVAACPPAVEAHELVANDDAPRRLWRQKPNKYARTKEQNTPRYHNNHKFTNHRAWNETKNPSASRKYTVPNRRDSATAIDSFPMHVVYNMYRINKHQYTR